MEIRSESQPTTHTTIEDDFSICMTSHCDANNVFGVWCLQWILQTGECLRIHTHQTCSSTLSWLYSVSFKGESNKTRKHENCATQAVVVVVVRVFCRMHTLCGVDDFDFSDCNIRPKSFRVNSILHRFRFGLLGDTRCSPPNWSERIKIARNALAFRVSSENMRSLCFFSHLLHIAFIQAEREKKQLTSEDGYLKQKPRANA